MARKSVIKFSQISSFFCNEPKLVEKGENAVESGHVKSIRYNGDSTTLFGEIFASMKDKYYSVEISFKDDGDIQSYCTCPRGNLKCHHIAAAMIHGHHNVSITDSLSQWSYKKPTTSVATKTVSDLFPTKPFRATTVQSGISDEVYEKLRDGGHVVGFTWLLSPEVNPSITLHPMIDDVIFSQEFRDAEDKKNFLLKVFSLSLGEIQKIAEETVGQNNNAKWAKYRNFRLTSSNFGVVLSAIKRRKFPPSLFKRLLGNYNLDKVKTVQWGRQHETDALKTVEAVTKKKVIPTGFWLHSSGLLGASPDGIIVENNGDICAVEVKCPFNYREKDIIHELKQTKNYIIHINEHGMLEVNKTHDYFHQIQGQLYFLNSKKCFLGVWTPRNTIVCEVLKDESWIVNIESLINFYVHNLTPHIIGEQ